MLLKVETKNIQEQLADYCRTGIEKPIAGTRSDRLPHYRRLVYNVIKNTMESAFPITEEWLAEEEWETLVYDFFAQHQSQTPAVWKLPKEFVEFVTESNYAETLHKPALNDLLWFEWLEIEVHTMPDTTEPIATSSAFTSNAILTINPYFRIQQAAYPIHLMHANDAAKHHGQWFILLYREIDSGQVKFIRLSILHAVLLEKLNEHAQSIQSLLPVITSLFGITDLQTTFDQLTTFCQDMIKQGVLIITD